MANPALSFVASLNDEPRWGLDGLQLHGILDELLLTRARARATYARLIDVAVVPAP